MKERDQNEPTSLIRFPFDLPDNFLEMIGYTGKYTLVGLYWQSAGDELAVYDPMNEWCGSHNHSVYLAVMRKPQIYGWREEFMVDLGSSDEPATHHMIVWNEKNEAYVATAKQARKIVEKQRFDPEDFF